MPWNLEVAYESAAKNGLTEIAMLDTPTALVSGDDLQADADGEIIMAGCVSAAIANLVDWAIKTKLDANQVRGETFLRDQTGAVDTHALAFFSYPFKKSELINALADNGNNAQVESVGFAMAFGTDPLLGFHPRFTIPPNSGWIHGDGSTTVTADDFTNVSMTWNYTFDRETEYEILGMYAHGATMHWARLMFKGKYSGYRPGVPGGDTRILNIPLYGRFGRFSGRNPPDIEVICDAADTAQIAGLLITPFRSLK